MGGLVDPPPDHCLKASSPQDRGTGPSSYPLGSGVVLPHRFHRISQQLHHRSILRCGGSRRFELDSLQVDGHPKLILDLGSDPSEQLHDILGIDLGKDAAVHVEHILTGKRIDILYVRLLLRWFEGGGRRVEQEIGDAEHPP